MYSLVRAYARFAIKIYCRKIIINDPQMLHKEGPMLLACNHPNSFLDGIILTTLFEGKVHSLARGDVFQNKWISKLLYSIRLLPVYRTSEGVENLESNYTTFDACIETFKKKEIVLIFSEGRCENEWHLRPLKKGTARLAISSWAQGIELQVIPTALNYSSFKKFGKEVHISFGKPVNRNKILQEPTEGRQFLSFNEELYRQLQHMVYEIDPGNESVRKEVFDIKKTSSFRILIIPALIGWVLNAPLFYPISIFSHWRFGKSGHFDSVQTSLLLLIYPLYYLLLIVIAMVFNPWLGVLTMLILPVTAWAAVQVKYQLDL